MKPSVLERPRPIGQSAFVLPKLSPQIPLNLSKSSKRNQALARFALAADLCGVPLPGGEFHSIESVVSRQWKEFLEKSLTDPNCQLMRCNPSIVVNDSTLTFVIGAQSNMSIIHLKSVIEGLEEIKPGLGWYVERVIGRASSHGMNTYDSALVGYEGLGYNEEAENDQEFAKNLIEQETGTRPDEDISDEEMERLRGEYNYFPSDLLATVDGHQNLLGWGHLDKSRKTDYKVLTKQQAIAAIKKKGIPPGLRSCVRDAVVLDELFNADKECVFGWDGGSDDTENIGAVCVIAWDCADLLVEMIEHFEMNAYNGGEAIEGVGRAGIETNAAQTDFEQLARNARAYFERWNMLGKLLSHFPHN